MLNDQAIHVSKVQGTIRAGLDHYRTAPVISRGEKFRIGFRGCPVADEGHSVGLQHFAMNGIVGRLANKNAALELRAEQLIAVRGGAARGGYLKELVGPVEPLLR